MKIPSFKFESVNDSRGVPTLRVVAQFEGGEVESLVPAGTSTGSNEAAALPVDQVIAQQNELSGWLSEADFSSLKEFDQALIEKDGTDNKSKLGGNTILGLSMLYCRLAALTEKITLAQWLAQEFKQLYEPPVSVPGGGQTVPMMVMIEGGKHAQSGTYIQELLINGSVNDGVKVWRQLDTGDPMGMEGGFDITFLNKDQADRQALTKIQQAIKAAGTAMTISIDVAANNIPTESRYSVSDMVALAKDFSLASIEDPFVEDDWESWSRLVLELKGHRLDTKVIGDDLTVTNIKYLEQAIAKEAVTGVIIKPNQVGSVSETLAFAAMAKKNNLWTIVSHRSGETKDSFIADLAVGIKADSLKAGAPSKPERMIKYERLIQLLANG